MADVFISYSRPDRAFAFGISQSLERLGFTVWWDAHIMPGKLFRRTIERELRRARCMIVIWSATSTRSDWVISEAEVAAKRGILMPVSVDAALPPLGLRQYQCLSLAGWDGSPTDDVMARLVLAVSEMLNRGDPSAGSSSGGVGVESSTEQGARELLRERSKQQLLWSRRTLIAIGTLAVAWVFVDLLMLLHLPVEGSPGYDRYALVLVTIMFLLHPLYFLIAARVARFGGPASAVCVAASWIPVFSPLILSIPLWVRIVSLHRSIGRLLAMGQRGGSA